MNLSAIQNMLEQLSIPWPVLAAAAGLLTLLLCAIAMRRRTVARRSVEYARLQAQIDKLRQDNRSVVELAVRAGRRLRQSEAQLRELGQRVEALKLQGQSGDSNHAYEQAIRMVRRGADAGRLVSDFGLSRGEAELVTLLHGRRKAG